MEVSQYIVTIGEHKVAIINADQITLTDGVLEMHDCGELVAVFNEFVTVIQQPKSGVK